jgi:cell division cycle 2-like protein
LKGEKGGFKKDDLFVTLKPMHSHGGAKEYENPEWNLSRVHDRDHIKNTKLTIGLPKELEDELIEVLEVEYRHTKQYTESKYTRFEAVLNNNNNKNNTNNKNNNNNAIGGSKFTTSAYPDSSEKTDTKFDEINFGDVYKYTCLHTLGGGTFSNVYLAEDVKKNQYALKKLKVIESHKSERTKLLIEREIETLRLCKGHINIVELIEIVINKEKQKFLVLEYCEHNLKRLIGEKPLTLLETKKLLFQLLNGLDYAHSKNIIHRDLKPDNLLVSRKGVLKIADFGSARIWERGVNLTPGTTTLRYRAPEILLGAEKYDKSVDVWSVGCIFAEMLLGKALFEGKSELEQTQKMSDLLGSFKERWGPGFSKLPRSKEINQPSQPTNYLKTHLSVCTELSDKGFDLINNMLRYDPIRRLTTTKALAHNYFLEIPKVDINTIPK